MEGDSSEGRAFSSITARKAAYERIREEIANSSTEAAKISWKRRYNELSLISCLPPELLLTIFKFHAESTATLPHLQPTVPWMFISHVCWRWRRVALDYSSLWGYITCFTPGWVKEMLVRSKAAPLNVVIPLGTERPRCKVAYNEFTMVETVLNPLSRVRGLTITLAGDGCKGYDTFLKVIKVFGSPAPLLETFVLTLGMRRGDLNYLPDNLFSGNAPRLTDLHIRNCALNWRARIFTNLRSLKVNDGTWEGAKPPADQFISALSHMSRLETLEFHSDFALASYEGGLPAIIAKLPHLVHLDLRYHPTDCSFLLDHITYPDTASVRIRCREGRLSTSHTDRVPFQRLVGNLAQRIQGRIRSLALSDDAIELWTSLVTWPGNASAALQFDFREFEFQVRAISGIEAFSIIRQRLPLTHLESLMVHVIHPTDTMWLDNFGDLEALENIHVVFDSTAFLRALSTSAVLKRSDPTAVPKFKALRNLTVRGWTFDEDLGTPKKTCIAALKHSLKARQKKGMALSKLAVKGCFHVEEDDIAEMQKIVKTVEWDGDRGYCTEESEDGEGEDDDDDEESEAEETEAGESDSSGYYSSD